MPPCRAARIAAPTRPAATWASVELSTAKSTPLTALDAPAPCSRPVSTGAGTLRPRSAPRRSGNEPPAQCLNSDARWQTSISHEIVHIVQIRATGRWTLPYAFGASPNVTDDHPGAPILCQCNHVEGINRRHCLQSLEKPGAAQAEGFAHYFAAQTWNNLQEPDCTFTYYKQFLDTTCRVAESDCALHPDWINNGLIVNSPPVPVSCIEPQKWRNRQCLSGMFGPNEVPTDLSVEMDWMGFYYKLTNPQTTNRLAVDRVMQVYGLACKAVTGGSCNKNVEPGWRTVPNTNPPVSGIKDGADELRSLGTISFDQRQQFIELGDVYGISEDTQP